jgi:hypothetical protein
MAKLDPVIAKLGKFYKLPRGQYFKFLNSTGHALHCDRGLANLTWDGRDRISLQTATYARICNHVHDRYAPILGPDLAEVRICDKSGKVLSRMEMRRGD